MKTTQYVSMILLLGVLTIIGCKNDSPGSVSGDSSSSSSVGLDIQYLNLSRATALFRSNDSSQNGVMSQNLSLTQLYTLLDDGSYRKQTYLDSDGVEHDFVAIVVRLDWLSKRYVVIALSNGFEGLLDLNDGSIFKLNPFDLDLDSINLYAGNIFAYTKDLKTLKRIDLSSKEEISHISLPNNYNFMTGVRIPVSYSTWWWDDSGNTPLDSRNFKTMLIDRDFNILAQVMIHDDERGDTYPYVEISSSGQMHEDHFFLNQMALLNFVYTDDNRLLSLVADYADMNGLNLISSTANISLSEVHLTQNGLVFNLIQKILPYQTPRVGAGLSDILCRNDYTIDSSRRYTIMGWGLVTYDSSNITTPLSYAYSPVDLEGLLNVGNYSSLSCFISGDYVYYSNASHDKIFRTNLLNFADFSSEIVVESQNISVFTIAGKHIFYSSDSGTYRSNLDGSQEVQSHLDNIFSANNVINLE